MVFENKNVSTILLGATNEDQLKENLGCIEVAKRLTENHMETIDEILGNKPDPWIGPGAMETESSKQYERLEISQREDDQS